MGYQVMDFEEFLFYAIYRNISRYNSRLKLNTSTGSLDHVYICQHTHSFVMYVNAKLLLLLLFCAVG